MQTTWVLRVIIVLCQPSRNEAGNPAFLALFQNNKNRNNFSRTETFCSKKLYDNVNDSVT